MEHREPLVVDVGGLFGGLVYMKINMSIIVKCWTGDLRTFQNERQRRSRQMVLVYDLMVYHR